MDCSSGRNDSYPILGSGDAGRAGGPIAKEPKVLCERLLRRKGTLTFSVAVGCGHVFGLLTRSS